MLLGSLHSSSSLSSRRGTACPPSFLRPRRPRTTTPSSSLHALDPHSVATTSLFGRSGGGAATAPSQAADDTVAQLRAELAALRAEVAHLNKQQELGNRLLAQEMKRKLTKEDYDCLPHRIIILRHGESHGNVEKTTYCTQPDHTVGLTAKGRQQAIATGQHLRRMLEDAHNGKDLNLFFMTSPYCRTLETTDAVMDAFENDQVVGLRQAVQLREQDFGNFQDPHRINQDLSDRNKFGRFWFRFPNGESGADVYDRLTIFEDHLTRDMFMGRFANTNLVLVTHGLTLRIFLMRWFHWSVDEFLQVYNPANCDPVVVEKLPWETVVEIQNEKYAHAKHVYYITSSSMAKLRGCQVDMCSYMPRSAGRIKDKWKASRKGRQSTGPPTHSSWPSIESENGPAGRASVAAAAYPSHPAHHGHANQDQESWSHYYHHLKQLGEGSILAPRASDGGNILPRHGFKNKEMAQRQLHMQRKRMEALDQEQKIQDEQRAQRKQKEAAEKQAAARARVSTDGYMLP